MPKTRSSLTPASAEAVNPPHDVGRTRLAASRSAIALFIEHDTSDFTVKQLVIHTGLSERTFYRYFPTKEDVVKPAIAEAIERIGAAMARRPRTEPLRDSIVAAFTDAWVTVPIQRSQALARVMNETDSFRAVWQQAFMAGANQWTEIMADRLGLPPQAPQVVLGGAVVAVSARLALEGANPDRGNHAGELLAHYLQLLGPDLFSPKPD